LDLIDWLVSEFFLYSQFTHNSHEQAAAGVGYDCRGSGAAEAEALNASCLEYH
jgi:hypothetical protein